MIYCIYCWEQIGESDHFCMHCGKKVVEGTKEITNLMMQSEVYPSPITVARRRVQQTKELLFAGYSLHLWGGNGSCCSGCAKYRDRIYSADGKDRRFPTIPQYICTCPGVSIGAYFEGITKISAAKGQNPISFSNRPFLDNRTKKEKTNYIHFVDRRIYTLLNQKDKVTYQQLKIILPEDAPRSFSGFKRMKNEDTKNFSELSKKASSAGMDISYSYAEKIVVKRYLKEAKETGLR